MILASEDIFLYCGKLEFGHGRHGIRTGMVVLRTRVVDMSTYTLASG